MESKRLYGETVISATHVPHHHLALPVTMGRKRQSGPRGRGRSLQELHCCFENTTLLDMNTFSCEDHSNSLLCPLVNSLVILLQWASWTLWFGE